MSGILFSAIVNAVFVGRLLVLGIFFSNSALSVLFFRTKSLVSILFTFETNLLFAVYLTTSFFTTLGNLLKSVGTGTNLSISNLSTSGL